jgi:hypothetical protein
MEESESRCLGETYASHWHLTMTDRELARFWPKVREAGECWHWTGYRTKKGYGTLGVKVDGRHVDRRAHRLAYEHFREPIAEGLEIDHLCRVPQCVNPWHLEVVTSAVNSARAFYSPAARQRIVAALTGRIVTPEMRAKMSATHAAHTHCQRGHEWTEDNTYRKPSTRVARGWVRECRQCMKLAVQRFYAKRKN